MWGEYAYILQSHSQVFTTPSYKFRHFQCTIIEGKAQGSHHVQQCDVMSGRHTRMVPDEESQGAIVQSNAKL